MSIVEVTGVQVFANGLAGFAVESPIPGSRHRAAAVEVKGWAVGGDRRVVAVEVHGGGPIRALPLGRPREDVAARFPHAPDAAACGFQHLIDLAPAPAPPAFQVTVVAVLEDGERAPLARVSGRPVAGPGTPAGRAAPDAGPKPGGGPGSRW